MFVSLSFSGSTCRPHPYRKRPTLGNVSNQHMHHSTQQSYSLAYQDSYSPEYPSLLQVTTRFSPFRNINIKGTIILHSALLGFITAQLLVCQAVWWDLFWCHLLDLLRNPWPTCTNSRRTLTLGWGEQDSVSRYIQPCFVKATLTIKSTFVKLLIMLEHNAVVIWLVCPSSSLVSLTTVSRFATTVILPAHPCLTSAQEQRPPVLVASQIPSSTG